MGPGGGVRQAVRPAGWPPGWPADRAAVRLPTDGWSGRPAVGWPSAMLSAEADRRVEWRMACRPANVRGVVGPIRTSGHVTTLIHMYLVRSPLRIHKNACPVLIIDMRGIFNVGKDQSLTFHEWVLCYPPLVYLGTPTCLFLYINCLNGKDWRPCSPSIISALLY
jgi:hypothetical protein